jgi:hypothetical protein
MPMRVAAILGHELVHAAVGVAARHGKAFRRVAKGIGLTGQMAATTAGPEFEKAMRPILEGAGPLPHGRLQLAVGASSHSSRRRKEHSGQIKCACSTCGLYCSYQAQMANWPGHRSVQSTVKWT